MCIKHPKEKGIISEQKIISELVASGCIVSVPIGDNSAYDLIVEYNKNFYRLQCKTGKIKNGCINCNACSHRINTKNSYKKYYYGIIDAIVIYCTDNSKIYIYPYTDDSPSSQINLRVSDSKNNQKSMVRYAIDYELNGNMSALLNNVEPVKFGGIFENDNAELIPNGKV